MFELQVVIKFLLLFGKQAVVSFLADEFSHALFALVRRLKLKQPGESAPGSDEIHNLVVGRWSCGEPNGTGLPQVSGKT